MKTLKKLLGGFLAVAFLVSAFAGSGMEVRAEEVATVSGNTIVDDDGSVSGNEPIVDTTAKTFCYQERWSIYGGGVFEEKWNTIENAQVGMEIALDKREYEGYRIKNIEINTNAFNDSDTLTIKNLDVYDAYIRYIYEPVTSSDNMEPVMVEATYIYVDENGNTATYMDTQYVAAGTTWGEFFDTYTMCYAEGKIPYVHPGIATDSWETYVQNMKYENLSDCYSKVIKKFNDYCDAAFLTFYGMPSNYKHAYFCFEAIQDGNYIDSGTGYDFLIPSDLEYGSAEAFDFAKRNLGIHPYIMNYCNMPGATWEMTAPWSAKEEYMWDGYLVTITIPTGAFTPASSNSASSNTSNVKQEVQTPENNYAVFQESVKTKIDLAIAEALKAATAGTSSAKATITIDTGVWISFKGDVYQKMQDSGLPVQITFRYKGARYRVNIPAGADLMSLVDENGYCGFLNLMAHFGGTKL